MTNENKQHPDEVTSIEEARQRMIENAAKIKANTKDATLKRARFLNQTTSNTKDSF